MDQSVKDSPSQTGQYAKTLRPRGVLQLYAELKPTEKNLVYKEAKQLRPGKTELHEQMFISK